MIQPIARLRTIQQFNTHHKRVLLRLDLNIPSAINGIHDLTRIERSRETIKLLLEKNSAILVIGHFGEPRGQNIPSLSLAPVAPHLAEIIQRPVRFIPGDWTIPPEFKIQFGEVVLLENTRFTSLEAKNSLLFASWLASLADIYVNDAFAISHREHSSNAAITSLLPSYSGLALAHELNYLATHLSAPKEPYVAIVGGSKVETKIEIVSTLCRKANVVVLGGLMGATFLSARGYPIGTTAIDLNLVEKARKILNAAEAFGCNVCLPSDVVVTATNDPKYHCRISSAQDVKNYEAIVDVGPMTLSNIEDLISSARTIVWNGPLGKYEISPYHEGTFKLISSVSSKPGKNNCVSIAGGGDTSLAIKRSRQSDAFDYISSGGGAFLNWLSTAEIKSMAGLLESS
jgi:phosphoglycerate kinase